jgi:hypothetical protein
MAPEVQNPVCCVTDFVKRESWWHDSLPIPIRQNAAPYSHSSEALLGLKVSTQMDWQWRPYHLTTSFPWLYTKWCNVFFWGTWSMLFVMRNTTNKRLFGYVQYSVTSRHNTTTSAWMVSPFTQHNNIYLTTNNFKYILHFNIDFKLLFKT